MIDDLQGTRIDQARAALDEAAALQAAGMDAGFVLNNLFLAFYYPILALVQTGRVPDAMQSVTLGLFEQQFVRTGKIAGTYLEAVRRAFELKPKCGGGCLPVSAEEIGGLFGQARSFIASVETILNQ